MTRRRPGSAAARRLRLAALEPDRLDELDAAIPAITSALLEEGPARFPAGSKLLRPAQAKLVAPLGQTLPPTDVHSGERDHGRRGAGRC